jgi:imidazoleglycerol-phosphate dehydratase
VAKSAKKDSLEAGAAAGARVAELRRKTKETDITLRVNLDGSGLAEIASGVGFFDHMLTALAKHGALDLALACAGDTHIDDHHTVEDVGIALGEAFKRALGDKAGIRRFGFASVSLDEALSQATIDLSGRACFCAVGADRLGKGKVGSFDVELMEDFFGAFANACGAALHLEIRSGRNRHHIIEASFKAFARALREACEPDPRLRGVPSTKGVL